ncbi:ASCH domain-containing protein [Flavobacterium sp. JP2137]|uniref:ASCH domain-containing protein n=1 Tax=Flavobacterium sp. JP2137 TaxID=3414510 RepID=UPI003D30168F
MEKPTKALSIKQPWAELIALGIKNIENRTWKTSFRGRFLIHASKVSDKHCSLNVAQDAATNGIEELDWSLGCIIGEVDLVDCVQRHSSIWADRGDGIWHYVLENPVMYDKPIPVKKGALGFWNYKPEN